MSALSSASRKGQLLNGVRALKPSGYLELFCETCNLAYPPLVATSKEELLRPDWSEVIDAMGEYQADRFHSWFYAHSDHVITARSANAENTQPDSAGEKSTNP
jgi:hypothetical protein